MITVNGKTLEVGDTAVFRCGGKAVIGHMYHNCGLSGNVIIFQDNNETYLDNGFHYYDDGTSQPFANHGVVFDIVDIIKAPKPEIKEFNVIILKDTAFFADASRDAGDYYGALGTVKIKADITNHKLISAEVED